jgi:uncharacterized protein with HEPN domain
MARRVETALSEILNEIDWIDALTAGKKLDDFAGDRATRYIVERSIEIIAEASRRIPEELKALRPEIDWRAVAGIGNILRHVSCYVLAIKWRSRGGLWLSGEAVYAEASALKWTSHSIISLIAIVPVAGRRQEPLMHPTLSFNQTLFGGFLEKSWSLVTICPRHAASPLHSAELAALLCRILLAMADRSLSRPGHSMSR